MIPTCSPDKSIFPHILFLESSVPNQVGKMCLGCVGEERAGGGSGGGGGRHTSRDMHLAQKSYSRITMNAIRSFTLPKPSFFFSLWLTSSTAISSKGFMLCFTPSVTTPDLSGFTRICWPNHAAGSISL